MRKPLMLAVSAAFLFATAAAVAFPFETSWHMPAHGVRAGAGDIFGTGGQQDYNTTCAHCHINAPGKIGTNVVPTPAWSTKNGAPAYQPGTTYTITVTMTGETLFGPGGPNGNLNGFALAPEDPFGKRAGVLISDTTPPVRSDNCPAAFPANRPATGSTYVYGTCHAIFNLAKPGIASWTFKWIAPAAGTGTVTLFYGVVDGDNNGKSSLDDDVKQGTVKLVEN